MQRLFIAIILSTISLSITAAESDQSGAPINAANTQKAIEALLKNNKELEKFLKDRDLQILTKNELDLIQAIGAAGIKPPQKIESGQTGPIKYKFGPIVLDPLSPPTERPDQAVSPVTTDPTSPTGGPVSPAGSPIVTDPKLPTPVPLKCKGIPNYCAFIREPEKDPNCKCEQ